MNLPTIYAVGDHQYRVITVDGQLGLAYSLFGMNGWCEKPREGKPNGHPWRTSSRRFKTVNEIHVYAQYLLAGASPEVNND